MSTNNPTVKVGIAGLGRSGWNIHARMLRTLGEQYRITAVSDELAERRDEAAAQLGCRTHPNFDSLLEDPDVELLVVAVPSGLHAEYAIRGLVSGRAVVVEKPMATSLAEADEMIESSEKTGHLLTVFQNQRYAPDFLAVRRVIDSGVLGRIVMIRIAYHAFKRRWDWQTLRELGGGSLNNTSPHPLDQALTLLGPAMPTVHCLRDRALTLGDAEDHVKIALSAPDAPAVEIEVSDAVAYPQERWLVMGTQGGLAGSPERLTWRYVVPEELPPRTLDRRPTPDRSYNREELIWHEASWEHASDGGPGEIGFYLDLYESLTTGRQPVIKPHEVRRQIAVMEECRRLAPLSP